MENKEIKEKQLYMFIKNNPHKTSREIASHFSTTADQIRPRIKKLKEQGYGICSGRKEGYWTCSGNEYKENLKKVHMGQIKPIINSYQKNMTAYRSKRNLTIKDFEKEQKLKDMFGIKE